MLDGIVFSLSVDDYHQMIGVCYLIRVEDLEPLPELRSEIHAFCKEHNIDLDEEME